MKRFLGLAGFGVLIAVVGIFAAVALATKPPEHKVTICHAKPADTAANGWNAIEVDVASVGYRQSGHQDKHAADIIPDRLMHRGEIGDVAGERGDARILGHAFRARHVEQRQLVDRLPARCRLESAAREQRGGELLADEAGRAGDHDVHR